MAVGKVFEICFCVVIILCIIATLTLFFIVAVRELKIEDKKNKTTKNLLIAAVIMLLVTIILTFVASFILLFVFDYHFTIKVVQ